MGSKSRKSVKTNKNLKAESKLLKATVFMLLSVFLFMLPFYRGLYFQGEIMIAHIVSLFLFIIHIISKMINKKKIELVSHTDYIAVLLIIAYLLPIIFFRWANLRDSVGMVLWSINTFIIYLMVKDYSRDELYKKLVLNAILASGVAVISVGLLASFGYVEYADAFMGNRISSTFQYPNTLAAYTMILFFITFGMMNEEKKYWLKTIYAVVGFLMFFVFVFTYSRAAWIIFPFIAFIYFMAIPYKAKAQAIFYAISVLAPTIGLMQPFTRYLGVEDEIKKQALITLLIGMAVFMIIHIVLDKIIRLINEKQIKYVFIASALAIAISIGFVFIAITTTEPAVFDNMNIDENRSNHITRTIRDILPDENYVLKVSVEATSQDEKEWPWRVRILGLDENGKAKLIVQRLGELNESGEILIPFTTFENTNSLMVQILTLFPNTKATFNSVTLIDKQGDPIHEMPLKYRYIPESLIGRINSIEVENHSARTRIDYVITGLSMFKSNPIIGAGGGAWKAQFSKYQNEPFFSTQAHNHYIQTLVETGVFGILLVLMLIALLLYKLVLAALKKDTIQISIIMGLLALLAHSALDFNFSFLSIALIFWTLIGTIQTHADDTKFKLPKLTFHPIYALILITPLLFFTISLYSGHDYGIKAVQAAEEGNFERATEYFEIAVKRDPFQNTFRVDLGHMMRQKAVQLGKEGILIASEEHYLKALKLAPTNALMFQQATSYFMAVGQFDKAIELIDKSVRLAPLKPAMYEQKLALYISMGSHFLDNGKMDEGLELYKRGLSIIEEMKSANIGLRKAIRFTDETVKNINRVKYFIYNVYDANRINMLASLIYVQHLKLDVDSDDIPDTWRQWKPAKSNLLTKMNESGVVLSNNGEVRAGIFSGEFSLKPLTTYVLEIELIEHKQIDYLQLFVLSRTGKHVQFHQLGIPETTDG
ncbi:MAG: O-antigen ligase family protein, partial [Clostridiales bacterium]|nr:O-antigen ligase family protein [Clostridiales bacterium]